MIFLSMSTLFPDANTLDLYVELALDLPADHPCAMRNLCSRCDTVDSVSRRSDGSRCSLTVEGAPSDETGARIEQVEQPCHDGQCYYEPLDRDGFSATVADVTESGVRIEGYARSRKILSDVIEKLSRVGHITVQKLATRGTDTGLSDIRKIDFGILTELERDTLQQAVESGYYEHPRQISLEALADRFDVSKGTISQRLGSAERKLVLEATRNSFE